MGRHLLWAILAMAIPLARVEVAPAQPPAPAQTETRDFTLFVDGKAAGRYQLQITKQADGSFVVASHAHVKLSYIIKTYRYTYLGSEVWKDGKLARFNSNTDDDGTAYQVVATADGKGLKIVANGRERTIRPDVWVSTYWQQPTGQPRNQAVTILDGDTGADIAATLNYVGLEQVNVAGQVMNCTHYRVSGGMTADLWYDAQGRKVREDSVNDGHRITHERK